MQRIYMDANATTPLLPEVFEAMRPFYLEHYGNASSIHQQGQQARAAVDRARESVAGLLHCRPAEIVFTSGGTESDNLALFGVLSPGDHLITTSIEHHAVLHAAQSLQSRGVEVTILPVTPSGIVEPATLLAALKPNTRLVSIMYANNETGVIQPIDALAGIAHAGGALFHTDAVQAAGKLPLDVSPHGFLKDVDLLTISGHKIHAPKGMGALYVRRSVQLSPIFHGGSHERQRRAGTENVPGIVGLGKAAAMASEWLKTDAPAKLAALRDRLEQTILAQVEETGVNSAGAARVANTTNIYFDHVEAEALLIALDLKGLSVSGGSACQSGASEPSHVLTAMGLSANRARASLRFSLSKLTTEAEVDEALKLIPEAVAHLRRLSPVQASRTVTVPA
ncbi:cysteine desulfurase family protein [Edaphobacter sp. 12200R-103]|jgi:cysteine desulfurase|uniref:cysteine desulfurase family protein n=1 Tax=Edaphobacter sp. 12200R-103 TaxID=2703788 RepID=UPI00138C58BA|nr:cysteine desulfurase family protein [Edaphobacter sp. 12200R-103]QHS51896.1 cysteine desulfurase [Edaphobacter sp. 12200R-103]